MRVCSIDPIYVYNTYIIGVYFIIEMILKIAEEPNRPPQKTPPHRPQREEMEAEARAMGLSIDQVFASMAMREWPL